MNDSDETDLLLLIPPDFFMAQPSSVQSPGDAFDEDDIGSSVSAPMYRRFQTGDAKFNPNLNHSNVKASTVEQESFRTGSMHNHDELWASGKKFVHSTPKVDVSTVAWRSSSKGAADPVIREIDRFLMSTSDGEGKYFKGTQAANGNEKTEDTSRTLKGRTSMGGERMSTGFTSPSVQRKLLPADDELLMSLSSLWGREDRTPDSSSLGVQEERMRRKHCEQTIQVLQQKVLEFEQKIAVAIKVDRRKDEVLASAKQSYAKLAHKVDTLEQALDKTNRKLIYNQQASDSELSNLKRSNDSLQTELNRTLVSNRHLNECNELLEKKIAHVSRSTNEARSNHQERIAELEIRLSNAGKSEEILSSELVKWKTIAAKLKTEVVGNEELKAIRGRCQQLEAEKANLEREHREKVDSLQAKEKTLLKELENQRHSLKTFYQNQLDEAVAQKLTEFQQQLDSVEANMRKEGKQRERIIAERAIRQMELINQKNEQEFTLLTEKHHEEIDLHRIQLSNAKKCVLELTEKVEAFQSKRTDIAERLHNVMETQWQRALEILASPTTSEGKGDSSETTNDAHKTNAENEVFQTPTTSARRCLTASGTTDGNNGERGTVDRVQEYIELLLEKSPRDLNGLESILDTPSGKSENIRRSGSDRHSRFTPKPWK